VRETGHHTASTNEVRRRPENLEMDPHTAGGNTYNRPATHKQGLVPVAQLPTMATPTSPSDAVDADEHGVLCGAELQNDVTTGLN
jgi:hypothetical protein